MIKRLLSENLFDLIQSGTQSPETGNNGPDLFDSQLNSQLLSLIKDKLDIIEKFNTFKQCLVQANVHAEMLPIITTIIEDDTKEVGNLQALLKCVSDEADKIDEGQMEVEQVLN